MAGIPGVSADANRITEGKGYVHEHSFEVGNTVVVIRNIGSLMITDGSNSPLPILIGIIMALMGMTFLFGSAKLFGILLLGGGIALLAWGLNRKPDIFMSIGTCDGRRTNIVSKDKAGLVRLMGFFRDKIDNNSSDTATINITGNQVTIEGGVAAGKQSAAGGAHGTINAGYQP